MKNIGKTTEILKNIEKIKKQHIPINNMEKCCNDCEKYFRKNDLTYIYFSNDLNKLCKSCHSRMKYFLKQADNKLKK